ncbi:probable aquaporin NIP5-1 isoform X1 [Neltuma alba]|uniref:probable aquaporin NIP5-1 isoform X1 n=2 Tax=Neltuma alba TaxID=207710 RepID=UPI0010A46001|nr:probable aquaporin NIP5-1 isoform X1 [Prosopis alba]
MLKSMSFLAHLSLTNRHFSPKFYCSSCYKSVNELFFSHTIKEGEMIDSEVDPPSTTATPAPLFSSGRVDSLSSTQNSMPLKCECIPTIRTHSSFSIRNASLSRKTGAEFLGTFILMFAASAGPILNQKYNGVEGLIGNAACSGLAVTIVVLSIGHISGAHLNPSVTIAFAAFRHFPWVHVPAYILAQVAASICASFTVKGIFHPLVNGEVTVPSVSTSLGQAFVLESIITFNLMFVITAVATDTRAVGEMAGIAIGTTVLLNILISGPASGGSMNPVRTLGAAVAVGNYKDLWLYFIAPTIGALAGAGAYTMIKLRDDDPNPQHQV